MAGRGPRHYTKDSPQSRDGHLVKEGSRRAISPDPPPIAGLAHPPAVRLDLEAQPNLVGSHGIQTPPLAVEQKLADQHGEIQRLLNENQRLAVTHIALRQELAAAQQEMMRLQQNRAANDTEKEQRLNITQVALRQELADAKQEVNKLQEALNAIRAEKDQHFRAAIDKSARMEIELQATQSLKSDFEKLRFDREELAAHAEFLSAEVQKIPVKDQEIASLKREVDELLHRHQQARMDFEQQKKLNLGHMEQLQAMEKSAFAMTREIERLRSELVNADRRHYALLSTSSGGIAGSGFQKPAQPAGVFENSYGSSQDALKGSSSENKSTANAPKFGSGVDGSEGLLPKPTSAKTDLDGGWSKHDAPNGRSFYYNVVTGVTQWDKPSAMAAGIDANSVHQRQLQQPQSTATQELSPELGVLHQQQKPALQQQQPGQQPVSPATVQPAQQMQPGSTGVSLLVLGLSEGISDRDLASIFLPYGAILYAKVMADAKPGPPQFYGIVTMENAQAAEAAAGAVNGMFILGRRIKVEIQLKDQVPPLQAHAPHLLQQGMVQGGVGPVRTHHRAGASAGHWPY